MNANILPIDVLTIPRAQPESRPVGKCSAKAKDWEQLGPDDQQLVSKTSSDNLRAEQGQQPTSTEVDSSDNIACDTHQVERKSSDSDFKNVLKRQIEAEQPVNEQAQSQVVSQMQQSHTNGDSQQTQPILGLQTVIIPLAEQAVPEQSNLNIAGGAAPSATQNQPTNPNELLTIPENQQQISPQDSSKLAQPILATSQNVESPEQTAITTTTPEIITPQIPQEGQIPVAQESTANIVNEQVQQVQENVAPTTQRSVETIVQTESSQDTASANEPAELEISTDADVNTQLIDVADQPRPLENEQSPALPPETIVQQGTPDQTLESKITKGRRQGGGKSNIDNSKDNSAQDKSAGSLNSQSNHLNSELASNGLSDRLGIEKVELINGKDGSPNSQPVNFAPMISRGAVASDVTAQIAGNRPLIAEPTKADAAGNAARDVSLSIREQITQSVQDAAGQGSRQISIQLNPPELGRVSIKFTEKGAELTGQLEVTNPQTRAEIRQAIPEILRSLELSGINVKRIDVSLSDLAGRSNQESPRDNFTQQLWEHSSNHGFNEQGKNHSPYDSFSASSYSANASQTIVQSSFGYNPQQSSPSDKLLDVLV